MMQKEALLTTPEIELTDEGLIIQYEAINSNAIYDFCNLDGRILTTGKIVAGPETKLDLRSFAKGSYNLFVLDGDQVFKHTLRL